MKAIPSACPWLRSWMPAAAWAQEEVIVTQSASGQEIRGFLVEMSPTTLSLLVGGNRMELPIDRVVRIDVRTDSVKDGAAIGAVIMGGLTALGCTQIDGSAGVCATAAVVYTGIGALIGAGIDALHKGRTTIYRKPGAVALTAAPAARGVRAQLRLRW